MSEQDNLVPLFPSFEQYSATMNELGDWIGSWMQIYPQTLSTYEGFNNLCLAVKNENTRAVWVNGGSRGYTGILSGRFGDASANMFKDLRLSTLSPPDVQRAKIINLELAMKLYNASGYVALGAFIITNLTALIDPSRDTFIRINQSSIMREEAIEKAVIMYQVYKAFGSTFPVIRDALSLRFEVISTSQYNMIIDLLERWREKMDYTEKGLLNLGFPYRVQQ